jgi:hypothetical protein
MKYLRVVLAVKDEDLDTVMYDLDGFIEDHDLIQGAYVAKFDTRDEAIGDNWKDAR